MAVLAAPSERIGVLGCTQNGSAAKGKSWADTEDDTTASEEESPAAIDKCHALLTGMKYIDDAIRLQVEGFAAVSLKLDAMVGRAQAQTIVVETSGARSRIGRKAKACRSRLT